MSLEEQGTPKASGSRRSPQAPGQTLSDLTEPASGRAELTGSAEWGGPPPPPPRAATPGMGATQGGQGKDDDGSDLAPCGRDCR